MLIDLTYLIPFRKLPVIFARVSWKLPRKYRMNGHGINLFYSVLADMVSGATDCREQDPGTHQYAPVKEKI